jgi:hypothetical protein
LFDGLEERAELGENLQRHFVKDLANDSLLRGIAMGSRFGMALCLGCMCSANLVSGIRAAEPEVPSNARPISSEEDLRTWLENMVWHHRFSDAEIAQATGMTPEEITRAKLRLNISIGNKPDSQTDGRLLVLPYPGGRHPRIGFLEGAVRPQRETKASVFLPWDPSAYVVLDIPEAIWWNNGGQRELLYLAHTHVPTTWTKQNIELKPLEWQKQKDGSYRMERKLPNQVSFGTEVRPGKDGVRMRMWLTNGTKDTLTGLRVQNCVMFKGAPEFAALNNDNKTFQSPYVACRSRSGNRYVISAWSHCERTWGNVNCPCMHSDPQFPDCGPGQTVELQGWLSFYEGEDLSAELKRLEALNWDKAE